MASKRGPKRNVGIPATGVGDSRKSAAARKGARNRSADTTMKRIMRKPPKRKR